jgi:protein TonB
MAPVTFVCELCGAPGRAEAPGAAQCMTCGQVALVGSSAPPAPAPDPFAAAGTSPSDAAAPDDVDFVLEDEVTAPPRRLASLWVPPGRGEGPTPEPGSIPAFRRVRAGRRAFATVGVLAAGGALALGAAVGAGFLDLSPAGREEPAPRLSGAGADAAARPELPPSPAAPAAPDPGARAGPDAPSLPPPRPSAAAVLRQAKPARAAAPQPLPGSEGERLRDVQLAAYRNPAPVDRLCVPRTLRERPEVAERLPEEIRARFPVAASGAVGPVEVIGEVSDPEVEDAIEEAIRGCPFVPGADEEGRPIPLSVVMRIRFAVQ